MRHSELRHRWMQWGQSRRTHVTLSPLGASVLLPAAIIFSVTLSLGLGGCGYVSTGASLTDAQRQQLTSRAERAAAPDTAKVQTAFDGSDVSVTVTVGWTPQIGIGDIAKEQERVKTICFREQQTLWASDVPLRQATVLVLGPVQDDYADMILDAHALARLAATTAATLSWSSLTPDGAWSKYDAVWLRANYQPHVVGS